MRLLRYFYKFSLYLGLLAYPFSSAVAGYTVYGVRNEFPMNDGQKLYRDLYVNMGTAQGIKVGSKLDVYRMLSTADLLNQRNGPNITFRFAKLKVIHVEDSSAVARVIELVPGEEIPNYGYSDVMVGDAVEVSRH
jgi:hypothetical protein